MEDQRNTDELTGSMDGGRGRDAGIGMALLAAACGIGIGMLTAPESGQKTRERLRKRASALGGDVAHRLDAVQDSGARASRRARKRFAKLQHDAEERWEATQARVSELEDQLHHFGRRENEGNRGMAAVLGLAAGAGLAYFMMAEDTAEARTKVREMATDLREQATDRWQQFRRTGEQAATEAKDFVDDI